MCHMYRNCGYLALHGISTESTRIVWLCFKVLMCSLQLQMEKEKQNYDFENIQSQLDKALGQATRLQKERETVQLDADRMRDKYEKGQVS